MGAAENLSNALHLHPTVKAFTNEGYAYAWVKEHPGTQQKYLLVEREPRHFYRTRQSLGVDLEVWQQAKNHGISKVIMVYEGAQGKIVYSSKMGDWRSFGEVVVQRDFKDQMQLSVKCMEVLEKDGEHGVAETLA